MSKADPEVLSRRALNRATLARQMLLERAALSIPEGVERLFAMQAQGPRGPFVGLWSRLEGFDAEEMRRLVDERALVRSTFLRGTLHLTTAEDYLRFRATLRALIEGARSVLGQRTAALDPVALSETGRGVFAKGAAPFEALREVFAAEAPDADIRAMAYLVRVWLPLVQTPNATPWRWPAGGDFALAEDWLGRAIDEQARPAELLRRYLAAFGPATYADAVSWAGFRLKAAWEALRPEVAVFRDERKRELFDLPEAPRPGEDTAAPVRFLPEFDNLVLSHADRTRVISDAAKARVVSKNLLVAPSVLVDGEVAGVWKTEVKRGVARLNLELFGSQPKAVVKALEAEGEGLVRMVEPGAKGFEVVVS